MKFAKYALASAATAGLAFAALTALPTFAKEMTVMVGGAPMFPFKNIIQNAVNSKDHTTLVAAVKAADLVDTLSGKGPFTVFAPTNDAFAKLPAGTVETLLKPENKTQLTQVLTYHVVPGRITASDLTAMINKGGGKAMLKTVEGEDLSFGMKDGAIWVWDAKGDSAKITIKNVLQSNGVIHVNRHSAVAELTPPQHQLAPPRASRGGLLPAWRGGGPLSDGSRGFAMLSDPRAIRASPRRGPELQSRIRPANRSMPPKQNVIERAMALMVAHGSHFRFFLRRSFIR